MPQASNANNRLGSQQPMPQAGGGPDNPHVNTILVVDDNFVNRQILCAILDAEYETLEAENGSQALALLREPGRRIALILLDIGMPVMDGYTFMAAVRPDPRLSGIPIIVTTSNDSEEDELRCLAAGASDFVTKPYKPEIVKHRIASILRLRESASLLNLLEYDQLTGLYSKEFFYQYVSQQLECQPDTAFDMLCCDISKFKLVNERYGIEKGDELLAFIGHRLKASTGGRCLCGRIGSDEFAVLAPHAPSLEEKINDNAFDDWLNKIFSGAPIPNIQLKFGIYTRVDRGIPVSGMCDRALLALNRIKDQYNRKLSLYDDTLRLTLLREQRILDNMERGLTEKQFQIYLQPKYDVQNGGVAGAESLVRWIHPAFGFMSPGEFIPLFERNGFITLLDRYMVEGTCQILRNWQENGHPMIPISVNISRVCFDIPDLPARIRSITDSYAIPRELLHLEVTESAYMDNPDQIISMVTEMRQMGFKIEMDDFGAGYSSLNMLNKLPIDLLKLDMSFLRQADTADHKSILAFIVSLAKWLNLETIAEGVETESQMEQLKSMGCRYIQGFYYAKPMPLPEFEAYLAGQAVCLGKGAPRPVQPMQPPEAQAARGVPTILVVEDMAINRAILNKLLCSHYRVKSAVNGQEGYELLQAEHAQIDLVLLDLMMPVMDGFQFMELLTHDRVLSKIPVVITSEPDNDSELRALKLGADNFVAKPYQPTVLLHHIQSSLDKFALHKLCAQLDSQKRLLTQAAYRDSLSELYNRRGLNKAVAALPEGTHTVFMLDIDNLKACNDTLGHDRGDELIRQVAETLRRQTREGDIIGRIGGDEFVLIAKRMDNPAAALKKGAVICEAVGKLHICDTPYQPSISMGAALLRNPKDFPIVCKRADEALYRAKRAGKSHCRVWEENCPK